MKVVGPGAAIEVVVVQVPREGVIPATAGDLVVAAAAHQPVGTPITPQHIAPP
jgi:hypothetical protein